METCRQGDPRHAPPEVDDQEMQRLGGLLLTTIFLLLGLGGCSDRSRALRVLVVVVVAAASCISADTSAVRQIIDVYLPGARPGQAIDTLLSVAGGAKFVPYLGYRSPLPKRVDGFRVIEFITEREGSDPLPGQTRVPVIRLVADSAASGRASLSRITATLGVADTQGCSGVAGMGVDETHMWARGDYIVVLTIPLSRESGMRSVSKLYFQERGMKWDRYINNYRTGVCDSVAPPR